MKASPSSCDADPPVPISLTVYNCLPPPPSTSFQSQGIQNSVVPSDKKGRGNPRWDDHDNDDDDDDDDVVIAPTEKKWFRPEYSLNLLLSVRLEIVIQREPSSVTSGTVSNASSASTSRTTSRCTSPIAGGAQEETQIIYSCTIQQSTIHPFWDHLNERIPLDPTDVEMSKDEVEQKLKCMFARIVLVDPNDPTQSKATLVPSVPLHPYSLRRLPRDKQHKNKNEDLYTTPHSPSFLPPNAVLIHYSDGLIRVKPSLYHTLLKNDVIQEVNPRDNSLLQVDEEEDKHRSRFADDLFDILDKVENATRTSSPPTQINPSNVSLSEGSVPCKTNGDLQWTKSPLECTEDHVSLSNLQEEHALLLEQIEEQERLLKEEELQLQSHVEYLQLTIQTVNDLEQETQQIQSATSQVLSMESKLEFGVALCQQRLIMELQQIYPIAKKGQDRYCIASCELPWDLFRGQVHEDEVSAALGYLAHCTVMMSKYLNVPLRYRIICNSSRSGILDEDENSQQHPATHHPDAATHIPAVADGMSGSVGTLLPIFLSRIAERSQVERGFLLLSRNVDCLAQSQGIMIEESQDQPMHVLFKIHQIYAKIGTNRGGFDVG